MLPRQLTIVAGLLLAVACSDVASPKLTLTVLPASRSLGISQDSIAVTPDSAAVALTGAGSATAPWTAAHGSGTWLTIVTPGGTGSAVLRWVVDPIYLAPGTYVDTITVSAAGAAGSPARLVDSLTVRGAPAQLIAVRRAWLPGERDSAVAAAARNHTSLPYLGDLADLAPQLFDPDSVTVVVPNPLYQAPRSGGPPRVVQFSAGWGAVGISISIQDHANTPWDTLSWLGVMWWNPADSTWKGWTIAATKATTIALTTVSTSAFDASGGTSGSGGGESQQSTGTYWEANGGQVQISSNNRCSAKVTLTSGVWKGGTSRTCSFGGRLVNLTMPRLTGATAPTTQTVNFDFRTAVITGARIVCVFPSPCTGPAAVVARLRAARARRGRA
ncbi:MAG TPA: hypothetical protein VEH83_09170 [Gemmatimonadales bacterium]|nr:hypothetical protein [Gemmatimonadales bacterium]